MSSFPTTIFGGFWGSSFAGQAPTPDPEKKAEPDDPLKRPYTLGSNQLMPGFGKAPPGSLSLYWQMRKYPACVLAYAVTAGPIFAGTRTLEIRKDDGDVATADDRKPGLTGNSLKSPEDKAKAALERHFEPLWPDILNGLESLNFGFWLQEVVWGDVAGMTLPTRFKDFLPWEIGLLKDDFADFAGFQYQTQEQHDSRYAMHNVCSPHFDRLFGVPRAENAREDWWRAVQSAENGDRMQRKASGISLLIQVDQEYAFRDASGETVSGKTAAQSTFNALSTGGAALTPLYAFKRDDIKARPELAQLSPIKVQQFDWGQTAPALLASIAIMDAQDKRIMNAWGRPVREAMEGEHGTKAEAGVQGAIGTLDSERVHHDALWQFNRQTFNTTLVTNFGPEWRDRLFWKPTPLSDPEKQFKQQLALAIAVQPGDPLGGMIDRRKMAEELEIPFDENWTPPPQLPDTSPPDPNADPMQAAGKNGNGRLAGAVK